MDILEVLGKIGFDWRVALVNLFNFLIVFLILKKFAFKPIENILEKRRVRIEQGLDDAKKSRDILLKTEDLSGDIIKKANNDANRIISNSKTEGDNLIFKSKEKATEEAGGIITSAHEEVEKNKLRMDKEFKKDSASFVTDMVSKILMEDIDEKKNEDITKKILSDIK
jgi:F-type H+-transporting ATPase subunit b